MIHWVFAMGAGELISQGNVQIYEVIKESGLDMGLLKGGGDDKEGTSEPEGSGGETGGSQPGILESIQHQGAQVRVYLWDSVRFVSL
jgi:hypothetical protein